MQEILAFAIGILLVNVSVEIKKFNEFLYNILRSTPNFFVRRFNFVTELCCELLLVIFEKFLFSLKPLSLYCIV